MIDLNHAKETGVSVHINHHIDAAMLAKPQEQRKYLGASMLGDPCARKIQYSYLHTEIDPGAGFSAQTLRIFQVGHMLEEAIIKWFRQAGFDLRNQKKNGEQFGFSIADDQIQGHIDGVLVGGPEGVHYPALWECKTMKNTKFNAFVKYGIAKANPQYYTQINLYQAYMDLTDNPTIFTAINKDTAEIYHEAVPFNSQVAQETSDKAVRVIQAGSQMLPRVSDDPSYFCCNWCDYRRRCHEFN